MDIHLARTQLAPFSLADLDGDGLHEILVNDGGVLVVLDHTGATLATQGQNVWQGGAAALASLPDLAVAITDVCVADCATDAIVTVRVANASERAVDADFDVELESIDFEDVVGEATVTAPLPAGTGRYLTFSMSPPALAGGLRAMVDPTGQIAECDEPNNEAEWRDPVRPWRGPAVAHLRSDGEPGRGSRCRIWRDCGVMVRALAPDAGPRVGMAMRLGCWCETSPARPATFRKNRRLSVGALAKAGRPVRCATRGVLRDHLRRLRRAKIRTMSR